MKKKIMRDGRGFTMVELLVVFTLIGILAAGLGSSFLGSQKRARDAKRKAELEQLKTALQLYKNDYGEVPANGTANEIAGCGTDGTDDCAWGDEFKAAQNVYMKRLPEDPISAQSYRYVRFDADYYWIVTSLERTDDTTADSSQLRCPEPTPLPVPEATPIPTPASNLYIVCPE